MNWSQPWRACEEADRQSQGCARKVIADVDADFLGEGVRVLAQAVTYAPRQPSARSDHDLERCVGCRRP